MFKEIIMNIMTGISKQFSKIYSIFHSFFTSVSRCYGALTVICLILGTWHYAKAFNLPAGNKHDSFVGININNIDKTENGKIAVDLTLDMAEVKMKSNAETEYTPMFVNGTDTLRMQSFTITGRNRMYWARRNGALPAIVFYKNELLNSGSLLPQNTGSIELQAINPDEKGRAEKWNIGLQAPYLDWMETATFTIDMETRGCANCLKEEDNVAMAKTDFIVRTYFPEFLYVTPVAEAVKMREISARAYIDFPVNKTEIYPDYRRNPAELAKIRATIDSVQNDKDITIRSLHISGTASPEGSYQNNVRLAKERTESLKNYVQGLYRFAPGLITTSFEPVDWTGLSQFLQLVLDIKTVTNSKSVILDSIRLDQFQNINFDPVTVNDILPDADKILGIVDGDLEPFARNQKIKTTYPKEYTWLLANVYPALRHSDYRIEFEIKTYTEVSEIIDVMGTSPSKLSLAELFVAANSQQPGTELYNRAFDLAVTMYPEDQTANLNAATAAMVRGDITTAEKYLNRITTPTPESRYALAMLKLIQGEEDTGLDIMRSLQSSSIPEVATKATAAVRGIESVREANSRHFYLLNQ